MMIFRNIFRNRSADNTEVVAGSSTSITNHADDNAVKLSLGLPEQEAPPTPNNSPQPGKNPFYRQSSEGLSSNWDVRLDPRALTVDCSCGFNVFRRFRNNRR